MSKVSPDSAVPANNNETEQVGPEQPPKYNFSDWNQFLRTAMRYHDAVHPEKKQIIDRIYTLRKFMSQEAISYLGGFMEPHPRYSTADGWDDWVASVTEILKSRDDKVTSLYTVQQYVVQFKAGKINETQLWQGLDACVVEQNISSPEQRKIFWDVLSSKQRAQLEAECPLFNPDNEVWTKEKSGAKQSAEQRLTEVMELRKANEFLREIPPPILYAAYPFIALLFVLTVWLIYHGITTETVWIALMSIPVMVVVTIGIIVIPATHQEVIRARNIRNGLMSVLAMRESQAASST